MKVIQIEHFRAFQATLSWAWLTHSPWFRVVQVWGILLVLDGTSAGTMHTFHALHTLHTRIPTWIFQVHNVHIQLVCMSSRFFIGTPCHVWTGFSGPWGFHKRCHCWMPWIAGCPSVSWSWWPAVHCTCNLSTNQAGMDGMAGWDEYKMGPYCIDIL